MCHDGAGKKPAEEIRMEAKRVPTRTDITNFDKATCRILKDERYSDYDRNVVERSENGRFFIQAENEDGKVLKLKFLRVQDGDSIDIMMFDDFYGDYLTCVRVS